MLFNGKELNIVIAKKNENKGTVESSCNNIAKNGIVNFYCKAFNHSSHYNFFTNSDTLFSMRGDKGK